MNSLASKGTGNAAEVYKENYTMPRSEKRRR